MTTTSTPRSLTRVLGFVNRVRTANGLRPLKSLQKGKKGNIYKCPIAASLKGLFTVDGEIAVASGLTLTEQTKVTQRTCKALGLSKEETQRAIDNATKGHTVSLPTPKYVGQFIERFDNGLIPNLVKA